MLYTLYNTETAPAPPQTTNGEKLIIGHIIIQHDGKIGSARAVNSKENRVLLCLVVAGFHVENLYIGTSYEIHSKT